MEAPTDYRQRIELPMAGFRVDWDEDRSGEHHRLGIALF